MQALNGMETSHNRRDWLKRATLAAGVLASWPRTASTDSDNGLSHSAEAIHQEVNFSSSPKRIYETLTNADQFQKVILLSTAKTQIDVSTKPAEISREPGGPFVIFGGYISGRHEKTWEPGDYSIARFELHEAGTGTKLIFDHTGFPSGAGDHLAIGWKINYWEPLAKFLGERVGS